MNPGYGTVSEDEFPVDKLDEAREMPSPVGEVVETVDEVLEKPRLTYFQLFRLTISFAGVQFAWAIQIAYQTPIFINLGVPSYLAAVIWLCGPVSGLVVQPLVGALSDHFFTPIGRRRPFLILGTISTLLAMTLIPNAIWIGDASGLDHGPGRNPVALTLTVIGFWMLDMSVNAIQGPVRALLLDRAPQVQHDTGFTALSVMLGVGNVCGYVTGFIPLVMFIPFVYLGTNERSLFLIGQLFLLVCMTITVLGTRETRSANESESHDTLSSPPLKKDAEAEAGAEAVATSEKSNNDVNRMRGEGGDDDEREGDSEGLTHHSDPKPLPPASASLKEGLLSLWLGVKGMLFAIIFMKSPMRRICLVEFFNWIGWFCYLIYITSWVGADVFGGSPDSPEFNEGVRYASLGLALQNVVTTFFSLLLPPIMRVIGPKATWLIGQVILGILLCSTLLISYSGFKLGAVALIGCLGIPWSITMVVPPYLVGRFATDDDGGAQMGVLNMFVVIPQLVTSAFIWIVILIFKNSVTSALVTGGLFSFVGAVLCLFLQTKPPHAIDAIAIMFDEEEESHEKNERAVEDETPAVESETASLVSKT